MRPQTQKLFAWLLIALLCHRCTAETSALQMLYMQHAKAAQLRVHPSGDISLSLHSVQASLFYSDRPSRIAGTTPPAALASMVNQASAQGNPTNAAFSGLDLEGACSNAFVDAVVVLLNASVHDSEQADGLVDVSYTVDFIDAQGNRSTAEDCLASAAMGNMSISNPVLMIDGMSWWEWLLTGVAITGVVLLGIAIATSGPAGAVAAVDAASEVLDAAGVLGEDGALVGEVGADLQEGVENAARGAAAAVDLAGEGVVDTAMAEAEAAAASGEEGLSEAEAQAFDRLKQALRARPEDYARCFPRGDSEIPAIFQFVWDNPGMARRVRQGWFKLTTQQEQTVMDFLNGNPNLLYETTKAGMKDPTSRFTWLVLALDGSCQ